MSAAAGLLVAVTLLAAGCGCGGRGSDGGSDAGDAGASDGGLPPCDPAGPAPFVPAPAPPGALRFALSVYHFNLQYVAGGLEGYPLYEMSEEEVEDAIIVESFAPLLEVFGRHPTWGVDLEMQGLMLDVMAARHPGVLQALRALVEAGQVELQSAHWSDQLVTAWPRADMERSLALTHASAEAACVALGPAAFLQEGQFGEGIADVLAADGMRALIWPRNFHSFLHAGLARAPRYELRGLDLVVSGGFSDAASGVEVQWLFVGDGELAATGDLNPYAGPAFLRNEASIAALEAEYQAAEDAGWAIVTVGSYLDALDALGVAGEPAPPVLDGTWQPDDTGNVFRWMGGSGISGPTERDNTVLTTVRGARDDVLAAEALVAHVAGAGMAASDDEARLEAAWRELLLAQVSDTTGWNPWMGEVEYGLEHAAAASAAALALVLDLKSRLGWTFAQIDTATGVAVELTAKPPPEVLTPVAAPLAMMALASLRSATVEWFTDPDGDFVVDIAVGPASAGAGDVELRFPRTGTAIALTAAGLEDEIVRVDESAFTFVEVFVPIAAGLIELGPGRFLVADGRTIRLAAGIGAGTTYVRFRDETLPAASSASYRFRVVDGVDAEALAKADRMNVHPILVR